MKSQPIYLNPDLTVRKEESLVKQGALTTFRALRYLMVQSRKAPSLMQQAASEIRAAWQESARPNA